MVTFLILNLFSDPAMAALEESEPVGAEFIAGYAAAGIFDEKSTSAAVVEWRSEPLWNGVRGWISFSLATQGAYYASAGIYYGIPLNNRWEWGVAFGPGYFQGDERLDLGFKLEFRTSVECIYRLKSGHRIGIALGHISNGSLADDNPGSEYIAITWHMPWPLSQRKP